MGWFDFMQESIAIDLGGAYLNSGEHGAKFKIIEKKLYAFGVKAAKNVVAEDVLENQNLIIIGLWMGLIFRKNNII